MLTSWQKKTSILVTCVSTIWLTSSELEHLQSPFSINSPHSVKNILHPITCDYFFVIYLVRSFGFGFLGGLVVNDPCTAHILNGWSNLGDQATCVCLSWVSIYVLWRTLLLHQYNISKQRCNLMHLIFGGIQYNCMSNLMWILVSI